MIVVFLGPDGTGKSTMKRLLAAVLRKTEDHANVYDLEFRFGYLPTVSQLRGKSAVVPADVCIDHETAEILSPIKSAIIIMYYTMDYAAHRLVSLFSRGQNTYVFARYWYDYEFQRGHQNAPKWLLAVLEFFVPRPDYIFYLNRDPKRIFEDKPELPVHEIERQQDVILGSRLASYQQFVRVRGDTPSDSLAACLAAMGVRARR